ncbi:MAG TPA: hypothetical protein V6C97_08790 [Oculatellaceae cyanobacterium]
MSGPLPAPGYLSSTSRLVSDMQSAAELVNSVIKEMLGAAPEAATLSISSNSITPPDNACVLPVDQSGGGTINTVNVSNSRDGQIYIIHSVSASNPITIANLASGSGVQIATFSGQNIVLTNPAVFISLKYNATLNRFQEIFPYPNWSAPGAIGGTTPSSGAFTTLTLSGSVAAHTWLGNNTGSNAAPSFHALTAADLPSSVVNSSGNLSPLFTTSISSQSLSFSLSNAAAGTLFGNFSGSAAGPSFNNPGTADQLLGVSHSGGGLEYKSIVAGSNITVTPGAGVITIAATGSGSGTVSNVTNLRLYTQAGAPNADSSGPSSTLFVGPLLTGNQCASYSGTAMVLQTVIETAVSMSGNTVGANYDVYYKNVSGVITLSQVAWTNSTTPPTRGSDAFGRLCKNGDTTSLLVGAYTAISATTCQDDPSIRGVSNALCPIAKNLYATDTTTEFNFSTVPWIPADSNETNGQGRFSWLSCLPNSMVNCRYQALCNCISGNYMGIGIGIDSISSVVAGSILRGIAGNPVATANAGWFASNLIGSHYAQAMVDGTGNVYANTSSFLGGSGIATFMDGLVWN